MPGTVSHVLSMTTPNDAAYENQPKHWNSSHLFTLNAVGSEVSGAFNNNGGITFGLSADGFITAAAPAGAALINFSAGTTSNDLGAVRFADSNGLAFGLNTGASSRSITGSYTQSTHTHRTDFGAMTLGGNTAGTTTFAASNNSTLFFHGGNNITLSGNGSSVTISGPTLTNSSWTVSDTATSATVGRLAFTAANGITMTLSTSNNGNHTVFASYTVPTVTNSSWTVSDAATSGTVARLAFTNQNGITLSLSTGAGGSHTIVGSHNALTSQSNQAASASNGSFTFQTLGFSNANNVTFGTSAGSIITASVAAPGAAAENNWHHLLGANTAGNTTASGSTIGLSGVNLTLSGTNDSQVVISAPATSSIVGTNGISVSTNGSTISVLPNWISSYENMEGLGVTATSTWNAASISHAVAFHVPWALSLSFIRIPISYTTQATTLATLASNTATAQYGLTNTFNAVIYSLGVGGNSQSLQSVTSGTATNVFSGRISITSSTQYSISLAFSGQANGGQTSRSTQYSISNTNYSFTTNQIVTEFSGLRFLDIPCAASLSPGAYWMVIGMSSNSSSAGAVAAGITNCFVRYSNHYAATMLNSVFGIMGSTNMTSGGLLGAGSFSTAGGGTTNSIPISAISSNASQARLYFQMLRSA